MACCVVLVWFLCCEPCYLHSTAVITISIFALSSAGAEAE